MTQEEAYRVVGSFNFDQDVKNAISEVLVHRNYSLEEINEIFYAHCIVGEVALKVKRLSQFVVLTITDELLRFKDVPHIKMSQDRGNWIVRVMPINSQLYYGREYDKALDMKNVAELVLKACLKNDTTGKD